MNDVPSLYQVCTKMSKTRKHQATYDYLSNNKDVRGCLLIGIRKFFNRCNFPKWDSSRKRWYKHKIDKINNNQDNE